MTTLKIARASALAVLAGVLAAAGCEEDVGEGDQPGTYTVRVSINAREEEAVGPATGSQFASLSADGRYVAFQSDATNLVPGDSNGRRDVFVKDRATGAVNLASINSDSNLQGTEDSSEPSISADGRYVAFVSGITLANGLGDPPDNMVFVHDRTTGVTARAVSGAINPDATFSRPQISGDGRFVAFLSAATNLGGTGTNPSATLQVWRSEWALATPAIQLVSGRAANPALGTAGVCADPSISFDGSKVAFMSSGDDVHGGDVDGQNDVFVADPPGTAPLLVSRASGAAGAAGDGSSRFPHMSADGLSVAFVTSAPSIVGIPAPPASVAVRRLFAPFDTLVVSFDRSGNLIPGCLSPHLSADGNRVAFVARPTPPDVGIDAQAWVRDLNGGIRYVSVHLSGAFADDDVARPALSGDGRWAGYSTAATNLVQGDGNGQNDIFVRGPLP